MLTHVILGMRAGSRAPLRVALRRLIPTKPQQNRSKTVAKRGKFQIYNNNDVNAARRTPQIAISFTYKGICVKNAFVGTPHLALQVFRSSISTRDGKRTPRASDGCEAMRTAPRTTPSIEELFRFWDPRTPPEPPHSPALKIKFCCW